MIYVTHVVKIWKFNSEVSGLSILHLFCCTLLYRTSHRGLLYIHSHISGQNFLFRDWLLLAWGYHDVFSPSVIVANITWNTLKESVPFSNAQQPRNRTRAILETNGSVQLNAVLRLGSTRYPSHQHLSSASQSCTTFSSLVLEPFTQTFQHHVSQQHCNMD